MQGHLAQKNSHPPTPGKEGQKTRTWTHFAIKSACVWYRVETISFDILSHISFDILSDIYFDMLSDIS